MRKTNPQEFIQIAGQERLVGIVKKLPRDAQKTLLLQVAQTDRALALAIKSQLIGFEDLLQVELPFLQKLVSHIEDEVLVTALKLASEPLKNHLLSAYSTRKQQMLLEELEAMPPVHRSAAEAAVMIIVGKFDALIQEKEIPWGDVDQWI